MSGDWYPCSRVHVVRTNPPFTKQVEKLTFALAPATTLSETETICRVTAPVKLENDNYAGKRQLHPTLSGNVTAQSARILSLTTFGQNEALTHASGTLHNL